ncbi:hypothetical protein OBBRIDRAFT_294365 [Obba rivulosa]|uniref:Uncharacterized protein n=1 Tax=Obba rivulosa TaxID=1052685 RepID=A0A8E2APC2_9APHY|nr:hypothetical protein OBBRIDRAFT_294365 [Obba rivulosa]
MCARTEGKDRDGEECDGKSDQNGQDECWWEHSRALGQQSRQSMRRGLFQDMHERVVELYSPVPSSPSRFASSNVEFCTNPAVCMRFIQIVLSELGAPAEQCRARALFYLLGDYAVRGSAVKDPSHCPSLPIEFRRFIIAVRTMRPACSLQLSTHIFHIRTYL